MAVAPPCRRVRRTWPVLVLALVAHPVTAPGQTGTIEGTIEIRRTPPRRTASRYPGAGPTRARSVQQLPAVVFVEGAVAGVGAGRPSAAPVMAQRDTTFVPGLLVVPVGTAVEFPNDDAFFHNVFSYSGPKRFDLGRYPEGESKTVKFDEPGIVNVYCEVHEHMRAAIVVVENPFHAVVAGDGTFRIPGIPVGSYRLTAWHADQGTETVDVTVSAGATTRVSIAP